MSPIFIRTCTLLGAVHIELGDLISGHEWFKKAEQLGAAKALVDHHSLISHQTGKLTLCSVRVPIHTYRCFSSLIRPPFDKIIPTRPIILFAGLPIVIPV